MRYPCLIYNSADADGRLSQVAAPLGPDFEAAKKLPDASLQREAALSNCRP